MGTQLTPGAPAGGGGPVGGGASGTGYRHIVRMDSSGRITGTTVCVDPVTGNTYKALEIGGLVRDQWNQNLPGRALNTDYYWKSNYGGDVDHYTKHARSAHIHGASGTTTCVTDKGTTTYQRGDRGHRCDK